MTNKKNYLSALVFSFCILPLHSQSLLGTQYPMGIPVRSGTSPSLSMGGVGVGVSDDYYGMAENPANLGIINRAVFSALISADFLNILDGNDQSNHVTLTPHLFSFAFPLGFLGTAGFSVGQTSNTDAKFRLSEKLSLPGLSETADMALVKEGGAISWQAGWGYSYKKLVNIGLAYQRLYFNTETSIYKKDRRYSE